MFADVDNDGAMELVLESVWPCAGCGQIPHQSTNHRTVAADRDFISQWGIEREGLSQGDIDGDGTVDIVGGRGSNGMPTVPLRPISLTIPNAFSAPPPAN